MPRGGPHLSPAGLSAASQRVALLQAPTVGEGAAHEEAQNMQVSRPALLRGTGFLAVRPGPTLCVSDGHSEAVRQGRAHGRQVTAVRALRVPGSSGFGDRRRQTGRGKGCPPVPAQMPSLSFLYHLKKLKNRDFLSPTSPREEAFRCGWSLPPGVALALPQGCPPGSTCPKDPNIL